MHPTRMLPNRGNEIETAPRTRTETALQAVRHPMLRLAATSAACLGRGVLGGQKRVGMIPWGRWKLPRALGAGNVCSNRT